MAGKVIPEYDPSTLFDRLLKTGILVKIAVVLVFTFPLYAEMLFVGTYSIHIMELILIWGLLTASLNLLVGNVGAESFAHGAFFGIGGYTTGYLAIHHGLPTSVSILVGMVLASAAGLLIAAPSLRLSGLYFAIATLVFQLIYEDSLLIFSEVTNGLNGLAGVVYFSLPGVSTMMSDYYLTTLTVVLALWFLYRVRNSGLGDVLYMIKQDESLARHLGYNTSQYKISVFLISTAIAGLAGGLYMQHNAFIGPTSTDIFMSFEVFVYIIVSGSASFFGPILAAGALTLVNEILHLSSTYRRLLHGLLLLVVIMTVPNGLSSIDYKALFRRLYVRLRGD